jgi:lipopolysaccharide transport system ATP-binding protein
MTEEVIAIKLEDVSKSFIVKYYHENFFANLFSYFDKTQSEKFWALRGINIEIEKGKIVGVIGRNGSGKTTLLKLLARVSNPSSGSIFINGKVSSMLNLGAGFMNELSGKENILINGLVLGMSKEEISQKFESIVEFSELNGFLNFPLQTYSQGMLLRLGFGIAMYVDADILLIDELIVVGDCSFQKKCFEKMSDFRRQGKTMVMSTQSMEYIERMCDEVYVLEGGEIKFHGKPDEAILQYQKVLSERKLSRGYAK